LALVGLAGVDLVDAAPAVAGVHESVVDKRIHLGFRAVLSKVLHAAERQRPDHAQVLDVVAVDLGELGIALRAVIAVLDEPVPRLVLRVDEAVAIDRHLVLGVLRGDLRRGQRDDRRSRKRGAAQGGRVASAVSHEYLPLGRFSFGAWLYRYESLAARFGAGNGAPLGPAG